MRDREGALLYVGVTNRGHLRQAEHLVTRPWATEVATTEWEHFQNRAAAAIRERELITTKRPRYNVVHSGTRLRKMDPATRAGWSESLSALGQRRTNLRRELAEISAEIAAAAEEAFADGMGKSEIARLAQISRPALDTMLKPHR